MARPEAKTLQEMYGEKTDQIKRAIAEFTSRSVLGLGFRCGDKINLRSGLYATLGGKHFVVTAGHDMEKAYLGQFNYLTRPSYPWDMIRDPRNSRWPEGKLPAPRATRINHKFVNDPQDLLIIQVEPLLTRGGWVAPWELETCPAATPSFGCKTLLSGCLEHFMDTRYSQELGGNEFLLKPFNLWTHVVDAPHELKGYDPNYHFLLRYKLDESDPVFGAPAGGLSGGPVFQLPTDDQGIAASNELLLGIQHFEYTEINMLRVTRVEHVVQAVRQLISAQE